MGGIYVEFIEDSIELLGDMGKERELFGADTPQGKYLVWLEDIESYTELIGLYTSKEEALKELKGKFNLRIKIGVIE